MGPIAPNVAELSRQEPSNDELLHPGLPYRAGQVIWSLRHEYARTVEDVLARRTRALLLDAAAGMEMAPRVARLMAEELGFGDDWQQRQVSDFLELARGYLPQ